MRALTSVQYAAERERIASLIDYLRGACGQHTDMGAAPRARLDCPRCAPEVVRDWFARERRHALETLWAWIRRQRYQGVSYVLAPIRTAITAFQNGGRP